MAASADVTGGASVIVTGQTYSSWQAENFTAGEISSGLAEDKADIDGDGFVNLVEYALGSDPHTRSPELTAAILPDGNMENRLTLSFTRPRALPAVSYAVEVSPNLSTWDTITSYEIISTETTETVTARDPVPADGAQQRFIRLRVTRQPW